MNSEAEQGERGGVCKQQVVEPGLWLQFAENSLFSDTVVAGMAQMHNI